MADSTSPSARQNTTLWRYRCVVATGGCSVLSASNLMDGRFIAAVVWLSAMMVAFWASEWLRLKVRGAEWK